MLPLDLPLEPGRVYRPKEFAAQAKNPTVVFERFVAEGRLERLGYGLYHCPRPGKFGPRPPDDATLLSAFLGGREFVLSGPSFWNGLRLGPTGLAATPLVYNAVRSGLLKVGRRTFQFRRVRFPKKPTREWYAVDLLNHAPQAGAAAADLVEPLAKALSESALDRGAFFAALDEYGTRTTKNLVDERFRAFRS
jgi:hypothetical protein